MSNGTDTLFARDPRNFAIVRRIPVRYASGAAAPRLNELEYAGGEVFANVYQSDWILRIDLSSGAVTEVLDLSMLLPEFNASATSENVLNGIALDPRTGHLLVTGKRWPRAFELRLDRSPRH
jgi:glutamine cyclotransferase